MIRNATYKDVQFILSKAKDVANEATLLEDTISQEQAVKMALFTIEQNGYYLVCENVNKEIAGWILLGKNIDYMTNQTHAFIYELYVLPKYRNVGIAKQLLQAAITDSKLYGFKEIRLNVFANNFAKEIYNRIGFQDLQTIMYKKL
ncbi:L-amino acid N-acyltransferase YncA [Gracilibacillus orientalis]|uniref:L-amino acid N-acyltransferase YncA n=1 Tax=Gracilibacillus orientalis TaxID=334253 RepID=A0A1I4HTH4_9BACI|nr:GNAT family N-acetyltransferase [Gracilibacillus orientalis]SFL44921.1 L-amino acid N-acyltransferase YncA [Gracilibacillus orientalis]